MAELNKPQCPLCGTYNLLKKYSLGDYYFYFCSICNLGLTHPMPTEEQLFQFYNNSYFNSSQFLKDTKLLIGYQNYSAEKEIHLANAKYIMKRLNRFWIDSPGTLLEIGCAMGFFLDYASSLGWKVKGVDLAEDAVNFAKEKFGLDVFKGNIFSLNADTNSFDSCISIGTMDHLKNPLAVFNEISRILKPNGLLIVTIGSISELVPFHYRPPEHLFYFSRKSLKIALEKSGFEVKSISNFWTQYSVGEFLARTLTYIGLKRPLKWMLKLPGSIRVPTNEVVVIAKKK